MVRIKNSSDKNIETLVGSEIPVVELAPDGVEVAEGETVTESVESSDSDPESDTESVNTPLLSVDDLALEVDLPEATGPTMESAAVVPHTGDRSGDRCVDLIVHEIPRRASRYGERLHPLLTGVIKFELSDRKESYLVDWRGAGLSVSVANGTPADTVITMHSHDLLAMAAGDLNPQVAMLSHKITVTGRMDLAMYVFNLVVQD